MLARIFSVAAVAFVMALTQVNTSAPAAQISRSSPNPYFRAVLPLIRAKTHVPILLPAVVDWNPAFGPLYVDLDGADKRGYSLDFGSVPHCDGSGVCSTGYLSSDYARGKIDTSNFKSTGIVVLRNGARAVLGVPIYKAAPTIIWDWEGRRYFISFPAPHYPDGLVRMANSMTRY
jgi:hypothetical protein